MDFPLFTLQGEFVAKLRRENCITQKNDATCIGPKRVAIKKAKRHSSKLDRRRLTKDLNQRLEES